jgi:hypothetical protein
MISNAAISLQQILFPEEEESDRWTSFENVTAL